MLGLHSGNLVTTVQFCTRDRGLGAQVFFNSKFVLKVPLGGDHGLVLHPIRALDY